MVFSVIRLVVFVGFMVKEYHLFNKKVKPSFKKMLDNVKGIKVGSGALLLAVDRLTGSFRLPPTFITNTEYSKFIKSQWGTESFFYDIYPRRQSRLLTERKHMLLGIAGLVVGFVVGVLVGRRNKTAVEAAVAEAKADLAKAKTEVAALKAKL